MAYYVSKIDIDNDQLRTHLCERLPSYMIPSAFLAVEQMPLSANGKVDVQALPDIPFYTTYLAPSNQMEYQLAAIWCEVLGVKQVGINDNFLQMGGNSLIAMQVAARIRSRIKLECPVVHLFEHITIQKLAQFLQTQQHQLTALHSIERDANAPQLLSFAQQRLWFLDQYEGQSPLYNIPISFQIKGALDTTILQSALQALMRRHACLRTTFRDQDGVPTISIAESLEIFLSIRKVAVKDLQHQISKEIHTPFDLKTGPLLRAKLFQIVDAATPSEFVLCIVKHHIVSDGLSIGIFCARITRTLYK